MKELLVFQTDFTYKEGAVCAMYGVVKSVDRSLEIIDGTHEIPQYDIYSASFRLYQSMRFWPKGTVFVSVVDPGVGTFRRACVAKTSDGYYVVTPDNGSLTHLKHWVGIEEVREIDETINRLPNSEGVAIFHGRDLFAYCAARLAAGIISYEEVGQAYTVEEIQAYELAQPKLEKHLEKTTVSGYLEINDPNFGNLWTNIPRSLFETAGFAYGDHIDVTIALDGNVKFQDRLLFAQAFGYEEQGKPMIYNNELMKIALASVQANFMETYGLGFGANWSVTFTKEDKKNA
ncbi:MAG: SAM hydrolase/SAM-dependent halogenase family protein [Erysipelotrichaceae bacterium]